jgi:hypothetical protein
MSQPISGYRKTPLKGMPDGIEELIKILQDEITTVQPPPADCGKL